MQLKHVTRYNLCTLEKKVRFVGISVEKTTRCDTSKRLLEPCTSAPVKPLLYQEV